MSTAPAVSGEKIYGVMAEFATPAQVSKAARAIRDEGYTRWDVYAPFPVHGLDEEMGVKRTFLPLIVAGGAILGVGCGYLLQWWVSRVGYPLVVQGKPPGAWQPFVPVTFELGVLFSAFATLIGMLALNGLPRHHHPLMAKERFLKVSDDRFVVCIEAADPKFLVGSARALLERLGGTHIDIVQDEHENKEEDDAH